MSNNYPRPMRREMAMIAAAALCFVAVGCTAKPKSAPLGLASTYNAPCHFDNGGASFVADTGCTVDLTSGTVTGAVANDLNGGNFVIDATGNTALRATQDNLPILTLGGTPTAAALRLNDSAGTPVAVFRGGAGMTHFPGALDLDGAIDLDGSITNAANLEHIGLPTWLSVAVAYGAAAGSTTAVATIGAGEVWIVHDIRVEVTTNFDATGDDATLVIGDGNDADGFCVLADAELQAADTEGTGWTAGWQCQVAATRGAYIDGLGGFVYDEASQETIDAVVGEASGTTLAAGAATVHILYTRIQ